MRNGDLGLTFLLRKLSESSENGNNELANHGLLGMPLTRHPRDRTFTTMRACDKTVPGSKPRRIAGCQTSEDYREQVCPFISTVSHFAKCETKNDCKSVPLSDCRGFSMRNLCLSPCLAKIKIMTASPSPCQILIQQIVS